MVIGHNPLSDYIVITVILQVDIKLPLIDILYKY